MRKAMAVIGLCFMVFSAGMRQACATEIDVLVSKLVEKGVLSQGEAQQIVTETKEEVRKQIAQGKEDTLPSWVQAMKLKGDFRLRLQDDHAKAIPPATTNDRQRARMRLRLGLESKVNDKLLVGVGLATGTNATGADGTRSTNQSMENSWSKKVIDLDYMYAQYSPATWATLTGGKFKIPFWEPGDMIWDTDITPEGGAINLTRKFLGMEWFLNTGVFVIDESSGDADDPVLWSIQPGFSAPLTSTITVKGAVAYQDAASVKGRNVEGITTHTNSNSGGALLYDYDMLWPSIEVSIRDPFKAFGIPAIDIPYLALFGEYVTNLNSAVKDEKNGFMLGAKFGAEKVANFGEWQVRYNYVMLEKDAVLDILPDSDRNGGKTGTRAHEVMFDYGLGKNTWIGLDVYRAWNLAKSGVSNTRSMSTVAQIDWNMKF